MATVCAAPQTVVISSPFRTGSSSTRLKSGAALALPHTQEQNVSLKVRASAQESSSSSSRREAMAAVVAGAGLAGLFFMLPVGPAEALSGLPRGKPETRKNIKEELEKIKSKAVKFSVEGTKNAQGVVKAASDKVASLKKGKFGLQ